MLITYIRNKQGSPSFTSRELLTFEGCGSSSNANGNLDFFSMLLEAGMALIVERLKIEGDWAFGDGVTDIYI